MDTHIPDNSLAVAATRFAEFAQACASDKQQTLTFPEVTEILAVIGEQVEWRVFVDGTKNLGHQASTVMLLRRLIDLTMFHGRVVIVYADYGRAILGSTAYKLSLMFAGTDPRQLDNQVANYASCSEIRFLPLQRADELREPVLFGFTGGADDMRFNGASVLNVRFFLRLQPYLWDDPPTSPQDSYYQCSRIEQPNGHHFYPLLAWPDLQTMAIPPPLSLTPEKALSSWRWYMDQQDFDTELASRMSNAWTALDACRNDGRLLWPVYGLHHFPCDVMYIALSCALLALNIVRKQGSQILLCSFCPVQDISDWATLVEALSQDLGRREYDLPALVSSLALRYAPDINAGRLQQRDLNDWTGALGRWILSHNANPILVVHRASDHSGRWHRIAGALSTAKTLHGEPAVHFIEIGPIGLDAFQQFLMEADLPSIIEGQATANFLTTLGKPFLQLLRREHVIQNGYAPVPDPELNNAAAHLATSTQELRDFTPRSAGDELTLREPAECIPQLDRLTQLVCDATDTSSTLHRYFNALADNSAIPRNDKLVIMLLALREVILAR